MIFVDTSVWIAAFRSRTESEAQHLDQLLDDDAVALAAPVRLEILAGASKKDLVALRRAFSALPVFFPTETTWTRMDTWIDVSIAAGERFGFADLLIGALAAENGCAIWSLDDDFTRMARLKLIDRHVP